MLMLTVAISECFARPAFATDGSATSTAKCAACHGPEGRGRVGPVVKGTAPNGDQIIDLLGNRKDAKHPPHQKALAGIAPDDAKVVADYVKSIK